MMELLLCEFDKIFLDKSYYWLNDSEIQLGMDIHRPITRDEQELWFSHLHERTDYKIWGIMLGDVPIGACGFRNLCDATSGEITLYIGEKDHRGGGNGKNVLSLLEAKAKELNLKFLNAKVLHSNTRSLNLFHSKGYLIYNSDSKFIYLTKQL